METVIIQIKNQKAVKLLAAMEELDLIEVVKKVANVSSLRGLIKKPMNNDDMDKQRKEIRAEWYREEFISI